VAVTLASSSYFSGCVFPSGDDVVYGDMSLESLIKMQSSGIRSIDEANTPRPGGVSQGAVLVALDVTKDIATAAVYWALSNVVRRGDNLKICGIITHVSNPSTSDYLPSFFLSRLIDRSQPELAALFLHLSSLPFVNILAHLSN
jgi:hypothetical protein